MSHNQRLKPDLILVIAVLLVTLLLEPLRAEEPEKNAFDIAIIIENRVLPNGEAAIDASNAQERHARRLAQQTRIAAKDDIDQLFEMVDRQMFFDHVILLDRPTIQEVCDIFGCPRDIEPLNPFPPVLWQITRNEEARLFVYYIGNGRVEGLERQLLFRRTEDRNALSKGDVVPYSVEWLHDMLDMANPRQTLVMLDTSFAPKPLPCASDDPLLIHDSLRRVRQNYRRIARDHWNLTDSLELSATTPVQPPHCDHFDEILHKIQEPLFTKFLLKGVIEGEADEDGDDLIELGELADYVNDHINHAARFQWGRQQHVRVVGSRSQAIASTLKRAFRGRNAESLERLEHLSEHEEGEPDEQQARADNTPIKEIEGKESQQKSEQESSGDKHAPATDRRPATPNPDVTSVERTTRCDADPKPKDCIDPSVADPDGQVDTDHRKADQEQRGKADDPSKPKEAATGDDPEGRRSGDKAPIDTTRAVAKESSICRFAVRHISPYVNRLVERFASEDGDLAACAWAAGDGNIELQDSSKGLDVGWTVFQPMLWFFGKSLLRPVIQDGTHCALNCDAITSPSGGFMIDGASHVGCPAESAGCGSGRILHANVETHQGTWPALKAALIVDGGDRPLHTLDSGRLKPDAEPQSVGPGRAPIQVASSSPDTKTAVGAARFVKDEQDGFPDTIGNIRRLQMALTVDNYNPGPIDGDLGPQTLRAVDAWRLNSKFENNRGKMIVSDEEFQAIMTSFECRFGQVIARVGEKTDCPLPTSQK